jgi:hypothetical protein
MNYHWMDQEITDNKFYRYSTSPFVFYFFYLAAVLIAEFSLTVCARSERCLMS